MNERIEQLAEQCWTHTNEPLFGAKSPHWEFDRQKFAQLIVRECADLCDRFQLRDVGMQPAECAGAIRKMFGVE